jgi:hypothetical protein
VVTASAVTAVTAASAVTAAASTVTAHVSSASAPLRSCGYVIVIRCRTAGRSHHGLDPATAIAQDPQDLGLRL